MEIDIEGIDEPFKLKTDSKANHPYYCLEDRDIMLNFYPISNIEIKNKDYKIGRNSEIYDVEFTIPKGFKTDLAKVPKLLHSFYPPNGTKHSEYGTSAVLHDYLYLKKLFDRKICDLIFLQAMKQQKCKFLTRYLFYFAVRIFGNKYYKK